MRQIKKDGRIFKDFLKIYKEKAARISVSRIKELSQLKKEQKNLSEKLQDLHRKHNTPTRRLL
jgi:hypothetical protein